MSVSGISLSSLFNVSSLQDTQNKFQKIKSEFQQLGQDLQSGNLTQAQQDFGVLTQNIPSGQQNSSPFTQAINQLGQDLQSGNLAAAQQDVSTIQQDIQQIAGQVQQHHHHHHHGNGSQSSNSTSGPQSGQLAQDFSALGQALQSGNLSAAQQAYSTIAQDVQQFGIGANAGPGSGSTASQPTGNTLSVAA